ncbi:hypothetical protein [Sphingomonas mucosissima]|uniref:Uncharacterized protein n=1 Tax=Sphingomonas mucosissima TaxID=370959 RepID=A0A245ZDG0_9SPHN|nr:hypothetical protein [Sphingomonas mucosissima]OWK27717.1 hypothetical protein SPMU_33590 [Sphingomonas mucosissima]
MTLLAFESFDDRAREEYFDADRFCPRRVFVQNGADGVGIKTKAFSHIVSGTA